MILALQLILALLLVAAVVWIGDLMAREMQGALGEPPLRDRDPRDS
jgi:hypothetical protein